MTPVEIASIEAYREIRERRFAARRRQQSVFAVIGLSLMAWLLIAIVAGFR